MTQLYEFLQYWEPACERKALPKLIAEVFVAEPARSPAVLSGRELLLACALDPWEADEVLSEIALLTVSDAGEETWRLRRLSGAQAAAIAGGPLSAHYAKSFIHAAWVRPAAPTRTRRPRSTASSRD